jgi:hypothetical protein
LPSLARAARDPTRHYTQNPGHRGKSPHPGFRPGEKWCCCSDFEALVRLPVVQQVPDAVHAVLEQGSGGKDHHPELRIDERHGVEGSNEPGQFADVAEDFERFHDALETMSTTVGGFWLNPPP